ncbi:MAG: HK97 family phage prohead protease [Candidatus Nanopelagicales bacterium]|jgi:HK97 family phage prohead protease|nr:HK97 family phage prohead protease [Candidatus Nanopelagicales bacterium]
MSELLRAAARRVQGVARVNDRPSQRRSAESPQSRAWVSAPTVVQLRADDGLDALRFTGVASATERGYRMWDAFGEYTEVIAASAFDETLRADGLDVPLVLGHDQLRRIARTTNGSLALSVTGEGLLVEAELDPSDDDVRYIAPKLRAGLIDEMSFAFRIDSGQWSPDFTEYRIERVDIHRGDVSIVGWGANPHTSGNLLSAPRKDARALALLDFAIRG